MREYLSGVRVVKALTGLTMKWINSIKPIMNIKTDPWHAMRAMAVFGPTITLTINFGIVAVIWLGGITGR